VIWIDVFARKPCSQSLGAAATRRGESMPPVDLVRVGEICFVQDGHHRVSVARALGRADIDAYVTEVQTRVGANLAITLANLPMNSHEREFFERVPLPHEARAEIGLSDPWDYAVLAEGVEALGFRAIRARGELLDRREPRVASAGGAQALLSTFYRPRQAAAR
jgi:hypothetical protein